MNIFLKSKHWQLFLAFCSPSIAEFIMGGNWVEENQMSWYMILNFLAGLTYLGWIWAVASRLRGSVPPKHLILFQIAFVTTACYALVMGYLIRQNPSVVFEFFWMHILAVVLLIYSMLFAARNLKTADLGREAQATDYFATFILILFFPLGIWFLQPTVNRLNHKYCDQK